MILLIFSSLVVGLMAIGNYTYEPDVTYFGCGPNPCANNATCIEGEDANPTYYYKCNCTEGYYGYKCTIVECGKNAVCFNATSGLPVIERNDVCDEDIGLHCKCIDGFVGDGFTCTNKTK
ncbi:adhesive plaque matrix protein 2 [Lingula anatina]|uniref:Adhesive plaque matrix protein 2 n=1 Tax=Lingula anatina TaxID=7574 RepID=A0A1S3KG99_LINAN|nr:adhesive plaque matrix protein 2 [Lingula anatina]XP_013421257.1 adhesive plaque matrix protein 2 [Lingula anatina]|eukprot:XP_013421256.1 adhesive plaque matrix protein 2 [Lingula anatina]